MAFKISLSENVVSFEDTIKNTKKTYPFMAYKRNERNNDNYDIINSFDQVVAFDQPFSEFLDAADQPYASAAALESDLDTIINLTGGLGGLIEFFWNQIVTYTLYETINTGTLSGSLETQTGIEILTDTFEGADLDVSQISSQGYPTFETVRDSGNNIVTANFNPVDTPPDWQLDNPDTNGSDYALIFRVRGTRQDLQAYITNHGYSFIDDRGAEGVLAIVQGTRIVVDDSDPENPIVSISSATDAQINQNTSDNQGTVTVHSDIDDPGSGEVITDQERIDINASIDVHDDVTLPGVTITDNDGIKRSGTQFISTLKKVFRNPALIINNTNVLQDVINVQLNVQRLTVHRIGISYGWSLNDGGQDFVSEASLDGQNLNTGLTDNTEIHRQEPKDVGGADPDGRGTNQRHRYYGVFWVIPTQLGNQDLILEFSGGANGDLASIWDATIEVEEFITIN